MDRRAAILSIGDELTLGQNIDTNSQWLAAELAARGIQAIEHRTVSDDRAAIAEAIMELACRVDVLLITGGLGPTDDDLTRDALGDAISPGEPLVHDAEHMRLIEQRFSERGMAMPKSNHVQAMRPRSMRCLPNPYGTAPGLLGRPRDCLIAAMPGPPREMQPMFFALVVPELPRDELGNVLLCATVHEVGLSEAAAAERLGELTSRGRHPLVGITVSDAIVTARIRATGQEDQIRPLVDADLEEIERRWHPYAFGREDRTLAGALGESLSQIKRKLATAESCTGGWLGKLIVDEPRASSWYNGGWVTYTNELKMSEIAVPEPAIAAHGAVSREVAEHMAMGALAHADADCAISITGIAGPDGGTAQKPVGTVFITAALMVDHDRIALHTRHFCFPGERSIVRQRSALMGMQLLRFAMLGAHDAPLLWQVASYERTAEPASERRETAQPF